MQVTHLLHAGYMLTTTHVTLRVTMYVTHLLQACYMLVALSQRMLH